MTIDKKVKWLDKNADKMTSEEYRKFNKSNVDYQIAQWEIYHLYERVKNRIEAKK